MILSENGWRFSVSVIVVGDLVLVLLLLVSSTATTFGLYPNLADWNLIPKNCK